MTPVTHRWPVLVLVWLGLGQVAACARPEPPRGGPEDRLPPFVVETVPDTFATVEAGLREIRFRFSERISERPTAGSLDDAVLVSPSVGNVRVSHGRDAIEVTLQEGLRPGQVYRITLLPVIADMFSNRLRDAFDLVVNTGRAPVANAVAGVVEDRVTGRAVEGARVEALFLEGTDSLIHWNYSDADGIFSLRFVPEGSYELRAWQDMNRNQEVDGSEPRAGPLTGAIQTAPDTTFAVLSVIEPDTTPARLLTAEAADSTAVLVTFDDFLDPFLDLVTVPATVGDSAGATALEVQLMNAVDFESRTAAADTGLGRPLPEPRVGLSGLPIPEQTIHAVVDPPFQPDVTYVIRLSEVVNVAGTGGGGGEAFFRWELPEVDSLAADSIAADTLPPDTLPPDTLPPDTLPVDTIPPPDTLSRGAASLLPGFPRRP